MADPEGIRWMVTTVGEYWYGPVVGSLFSDAVLTTWTEIDPTQYVPPIA